MESGEEDSLIMSTYRASKLEEENRQLKVRLENRVRLTDELCVRLEPLLRSPPCGTSLLPETLLSELRRLAAEAKAASVAEEESSSSSLPPSASAPALNARLQVRVDLECERRARLEAALGDAEKRAFAAGRAKERADKEVQEAKERADKVKAESEVEIRHLVREKESLSRLLGEKEARVSESEALARSLSAKAEQLEGLFQGQLESVRGLQRDLDCACAENKALVREMEALNQMFADMERSHVDQALKDYQQSEVDFSDASHKDSKGKVTSLHELLTAVSAAEDTQSSIRNSCFKEVTTKNGTRMVLSVSKTFMKLRDLIVEKKTLEDQVEKMNSVNAQLAEKVNAHEAKLFNVTDELNKTWNYVSTIKLQHRKLHTSEQILRAELFEKRQLLTKLRQELEFSRQNWMLVKQKTADSEREWRALRDEFRARRKEEGGGDGGGSGGGEVSSSESGFSDSNQTEEEDSGSNPASPKARDSSTSYHPSGEDEEKQQQQGGSDSGEQQVAESASPATTVFVPPLSFFGEVPQEHLPPLLPGGDDDKLAESYQDIYDRLVESTERSARIVSRLVSTLGQEDLTMAINDDDDDDDDNDEEDEDVEPRTDEDEDDGGLCSPDLISIDEVGEDGEVNQPQIETSGVDVADALSTTSNDASGDATDETASNRSDVDSNSLEESLEDPFPPGYEPPPDLLERLDDDDNEDDEYDEDSFVQMSSPEPPVSWDPPLDDGGGDEVSSGPTESPPPPILPPSTSSSSHTRTSARATTYANVDSQDSYSDEETSDEEGDSTAVTRLLIKHLPKQMSKLRHDKAELEDRVAELEARLSRQVADMGEMERRNDVYRRELEAAAAAAEELDSPFSLTVPISVRTPADEATGRVRVKIRSAIEQVLHVTVHARNQGSSYSSLLLRESIDLSGNETREGEIFFTIPSQGANYQLKLETASNERPQGVSFVVESIPTEEERPNNNATT